MVISIEWVDSEVAQDVIIYRMEGEYVPGAMMDMMPFLSEMIEESLAPSVDIIVDQRSASDEVEVPKLAHNPSITHPKTGNVVVVQPRDRAVNLNDALIPFKHTWVVHSLESAYSVLRGDSLAVGI